MIKILKSKSGMTLTELLVGMVIFSIITAASTAVLGPTLNAFGKANDLAEINMLLDNLIAEMEMDIARATGIEISGNELTITTNTGPVEYQVSGSGYLEKNGRLVLRQAYYRNMRVAVEYLDEDQGVITSGTDIARFYVTIILHPPGDPDDIIASRDYAAAPVGLS